MKRTVFALLALTLALCLPVQALTFPGMGGSGPLVISGPPSDLIMDLIVLSEEDTLDLSALPTGAYYGFLDADGRGQLLPVEWALEDPQLSQPGFHQLTGRVVLPEGASLAEGYDGTVALPVFRKGEGAVLKLTSLDCPGVNVPPLPLEGDLAALKLSTSVNTPMYSEYISLSRKEAAELSWEWDLSGIDRSAQGVYPVTAILRHPDWISVPEELQTVSKTVYVMDPTGIQIFAPTQHSVSPVLRVDCYWIYDSINVTEPVLEQQDANGQWQPCDNSWYLYCAAGPHRPASLALYLENIPAETDHTLRLRYQDVVDGQSMERFSDPVTLNIPENIQELMEHNQHPLTLHPMEGDRDGSDSGGADLPDISQPVPQPPTEAPEDGEKHPAVIRPAGPKRDKDDLQEVSPPREEEPPVLEVVTDSYTAISGLRLRQLIALGDTVLFEKTGASVEVPSALLAALELGDRELLEVTLLRPEESAVELQMLANGQPVTNLAGSWGYLPWTVPQEAVLQCRDLSGALLPAPQVLPDGCTVRFAIDQPGTYILQATLPPRQAAQIEEPAALIQPPVLSQQPLPAPSGEEAKAPVSHPQAPAGKIPETPAITEDVPVTPTPPVISAPAPEKVPAVAPQEQQPSQSDGDDSTVPQTALTASAAHQWLWWPVLVALAVLLALITRRWRHG